MVSKVWGQTMTDSLEAMIFRTAPTAARPLLGITILVVEDSRYACEAMRLLCLRSGARIRRADRLGSARRHLASYRPTVVIIDLGLPDGSGVDLIHDLTQAASGRSIVLGTSGDANGKERALAAGADGYLAKPIDNLASFQEVVLAALPANLRPPGPRALPQGEIEPDPIAFRDDLAHAADVLTTAPDEKSLDYVAQFLTGVARAAHDAPLEAAALALAGSRKLGRPVRSDLARVAGLVQERLEGATAV